MKNIDKTSIFLLAISLIAGVSVVVILTLEIQRLFQTSRSQQIMISGASTNEIDWEPSFSSTNENFSNLVINSLYETANSYFRIGQVATLIAYERHLQNESNKFKPFYMDDPTIYEVVKELHDGKLLGLNTNRMNGKLYLVLAERLEKQ